MSVSSGAHAHLCLFCWPCLCLCSSSSLFVPCSVVSLLVLLVQMSLAGVMLAVLGALVALLAAGVHQVPEGHVGLYWAGGALTDRISDPGWRWALPLVYTHDYVQLTLQTDSVRDVPCGTSTGVIITFDRIDVVNQLDRRKAHSTVKRFGPEYDKTFIFDKIHHEGTHPACAPVLCSRQSLLLVL